LLGPVNSGSQNLPKPEILASTALHRVRKVTAALRAIVPLPGIRDSSRKSSSERRFSHEPQIIGLVRLPVHTEHSLVPLPVLATLLIRRETEGVRLSWSNSVGIASETSPQQAQTRQGRNSPRVSVEKSVDGESSQHKLKFFMTHGDISFVGQALRSHMVNMPRIENLKDQTKTWGCPKGDSPVFISHLHAIF
jgi:hypothetical protein